VPITPAEINIRHQLALVPTLGRSFGNVTVYAGGGPALFNVDTKFINAVGFAVIGGTVVNVTGTPVTFSNDDWVWGGVAQVGATYALVLGSWLHLCAIGGVQDQELGEFFECERSAHEQRRRLPEYARADHQPIRGADNQSIILMAGRADGPGF
jgi:hypothetical protein